MEGSMVLKKALDNIQEWFLTLFFVWKINKAPWTMWSILSFLIVLILGFYFNFSILLLFLTLVIITIISIPIIDDYEKRKKVHDSRCVVIDEFVWVLITCLIIIFFTKNIYILTIWLILFRVFDILKPSIIWLADKKVKWWFGVILDDLLAWIRAWILTLIIFFLIKNLDNILLLEIFLSLFIIFFVYFWTKFLLRYEKVKTFIISHRFLHPNSISYFRIPLWVLSIIFFYYDYEILWVCLFSFAVITDAIDWMIARSCNLTSELWKSLDPLADKLVYFAPLIYFWFIWKINFYLVILFVLIDTLWQFSRIILKKLKLETKANNYWKFKTVFVFVLIFYLMIIENKNLFISDIFYNNLLMSFAIFFALLSIIFKFIKK